MTRYFPSIYYIRKTGGKKKKSRREKRQKNLLEKHFDEKRKAKEKNVILFTEFLSISDPLSLSFFFPLPPFKPTLSWENIRDEKRKKKRKQIDIFVYTVCLHVTTPSITFLYTYVCAIHVYTHTFLCIKYMQTMFAV